MAALSIGQAWEESSAFLRREYRLVSPLALAFFAIPTALTGWISPSVNAAATEGAPSWLLTLAVLIAAMIGQISIAGLAIGWSGSLGSAIARAFARVWGVLAATMIIFLPLAMVAVVVLAVILGQAGLADPAQMTPEAVARAPGAALFVLALLIVFLVVAVRIFPISAVAFAETANPFTMIKRAWRLTSGHFLRLLGLLLLLLIAAVVASAAVTLPIGSIATLLAGDVSPFSLSALIVALFEGAISAAISAVSATMVARVYAQLAGAGTAGVPDVERVE